MKTEVKKYTLKSLWQEMFPADKAKFQFEVNVELFKKHVDDRHDYTSHQVMLKLFVVYVFVFVEYSKFDLTWKSRHNRLSATIYYGLGGDSGPRSPIKRFKYVEFWNFRSK